MIGTLFSKIITALGGGPDRLCLERQHHALALVGYKGKTKVPIANLVDRHQELASLRLLLPLQDPTQVVSPSNLMTVKQILLTLPDDSLLVHIPPEVESLHIADQPADFAVRYTWSHTKNCIEKHSSGGASYFGDGWFISNSLYWQVTGTNPEDDYWLCKDIIEGPDIPRFADTIQDWATRKLPYFCDVNFVRESALSLSVLQVSDESVDLDVTWKVAPELIREIPPLVGWVIVENSIMPGVSPQSISMFVPLKSGRFRLSDQSIPPFVANVWPLIRGWATGSTDELQNRHKLIEGKFELVLAVKESETRGVGGAKGVPTLICDGTRIDAESVSRKLDTRAAFARGDCGWVPVEQVRQSGIGPMGRAVGGTSLAPIDLTPIDVLSRGSSRLEGPWIRVEFPEIRLPQNGSRRENAEMHLALLRGWGIPGGLIGTSEELEGAFRGFFESFFRSNPEERCLLVATKQTLDGFSQEWTGFVNCRLNGIVKDPHLDQRCKGLVVATPKAFETTPSLVRLGWSMVCLLEADALIKPRTSKLLESLLSCHKELMIGSFSSRDFLKKTSTREPLSQVFGVPVNADGDIVWRIGLRNPIEPAASLPTPYVSNMRMAKPSIPAGLAEFTVAGDSTSSGMPIPPRPVAERQNLQKSSFEIQGATVRTTLTYTSGGDKFVQDARKLVGRKENKAGFVPFMCYWPAYDSMTKHQEKWYFFWRNQVRSGHYVDTDLSYIFVHVYELINSVGVRDPLDGYEQLRRLWLNYRDRYPKLDKYLIDWIADYAIVNQCGTDPLMVYADAVKANASLREPDLILQYYLQSSLDQMPVNLIELLTDYRIQKSKFYLDGNQKTLSSLVPRVVAQINAFMVQKSGEGIFEIFKPNVCQLVRRHPFQSAVYAGHFGEITLATVVPYSQHQPLRSFLTSVIKHTENGVRELKNYSAKLRGYAIEPEIRDVIEALVSGTPRKLAPVAPRPAMVIDLSRADLITKLSDEVREMLLPREQEPSEPQEVEVVEPRIEHPTLTRPAGTPEGLLTDLEPVNRLLSRLDEDGTRVMFALRENQWEMSSTLLAQSLPGVFIESLIDDVNGIALDVIGDLLIANENGLLVVSEDFRDELEHLLMSTGESNKITEQTPSLQGLPRGWAEFATRLDNHQFRALKAIVELNDASAEIRNIAQETASMPESLVDSINELAMDCIGDYVIEPCSIPPKVEPEDLEIVLALIAARS